MNQQAIINQIAKDMQQFFAKDCSGHDWFHIQRVHHLAQEICLSEPTADQFIVEVAALLHDRYDKKLVTDERAERLVVEQYLLAFHLSPNIVQQILQTIDAVSFKKNQELNATLPIEAQIVQDADRLDAIGAIGIARTFMYAGHYHDPMYLGETRCNHLDTDMPQTAIGHFYDKLLRLKDLMNTTYAKKIAQQRQKFMLDFLQQFYREWQGENR